MNRKLVNVHISKTIKTLKSYYKATIARFFIT
jgi:hypothetical protein